ncbi:MAG: hypothetical protein AAF943_00620 [Pseudomonadota bacterium]
MEKVRVDHDRLGALYAQLGASGAEDIVCRALEELALRLSHCEVLYRESALTDLRKNARSLIAISDQIGMPALSTAARSVTDCIDRNDPVALAATLSRLIRIGERSLIAVWDMQDVPL